MPNGSTPFSEESTPHLPPKNLNSKPHGAIALSQGRRAGIPYGSTTLAPKRQWIRVRRRRGGRARARNGRDLISQADSAAHAADQGSETTNRGCTGRGGGRGGGAYREAEARRSSAAGGGGVGVRWGVALLLLSLLRSTGGPAAGLYRGADGPTMRSAWADSLTGRPISPLTAEMARGARVNETLPSLPPAVIGNA